MTYITGDPAVDTLLEAIREVASAITHELNLRPGREIGAHIECLRELEAVHAHLTHLLDEIREGNI